MTTNIISNTPENEKNEWRTPPEVFAWVCGLFGGVDFDTACNGKNKLAQPIWAGSASHNILTDTGDALSVEWEGVSFCNPTYDNITPWVRHAIKCNKAISPMLCPSPNGESRYAELCAKSHEIQIVGRLAFLKPDGTPVSGNTRGSSLFIINGYGQGSRSVITRDEIWRMYGQS